MKLPDRPTVAIVHLEDGTVNPALLFQVTVDPTLISPSEAYIRFGQSGDEIIGWKRIDALELVEVLGWPTGQLDSQGRPIIEKAPKKTAEVAQIA